jgi:pimeloyl-ACP methyl ester carboxylesterase
MGAFAVKKEMIRLGGVDLELHETGDGPPLLFLHSGQGFVSEQPFVALLAQRYRLIAPSHPGFGRSSLPAWIDSVDDIAHLYLELMDRLDLRRAKVMGCSIGGWIAADLTSKSPERVEKLILVGPEGVKTGDRNKLDIPDMFALSQEDMAKMMFHDPGKAQLDPTKLSPDQLAIIARNRETLALLVWEPYMHNPKLKHRLHRVDMPVLFMRGESDGLVSAEYLARYAKLVPHARIETIAKAGHSPQVEQPETFVAKVVSFFEQGV